ncbi:hypothetical protein ANCDUO_04057 [Ancylostoma duodenale]|uniref:Uncharacterized protein n=1 Tax=Ancylostoma duodenale TaxID=51022 RepID=A0A0C2H809_9BILA|nr:hypothetical protein ANCDUO_04057 [Ancylostoma duodenale]
MTAQGQANEYQLRLQAREKNKGKSEREWVVYKGELRRVAELRETASPFTVHHLLLLIKMKKSLIACMIYAHLRCESFYVEILMFTSTGTVISQILYR